MVLFSHLSASVPQRLLELVGPYLGGFFRGLHGVTIFFILSGYLITSILIREYDAIGRIDMKAFYCRRILRIFPAFYIYLGFITALVWAGVINISGTELIFAATHLINYGQAIILLFKIQGTSTDDYDFIGHFWSLSMEEQYYWIWPVALLLLLRSRWYWLLVAFLLALPVIRLGSYFLVPGLRGQLLMMLHTASDGIICGSLLAIGIARFPQFCKRLLMPSWAIGLLFIYLFWIDDKLDPLLPRGTGVVIGVSVWTWVMALVITNVLLQEKRTWYHAVFNFIPLVYLGRISYSVYLWQQVFLLPQNTTFVGKFPINIVCALAVGWLSYQFIELPFIRIKDKYFPSHSKSKKQEAAVAAEPAL